MMNKETITAFAFNTGKAIERLIREHTDDLKGRNEDLEAKLLQWYNETGDKDFAKHFGITNMR